MRYRRVVMSYDLLLIPLLIHMTAHLITGSIFFIFLTSQKWMIHQKRRTAEAQFVVVVVENFISKYSQCCKSSLIPGVETAFLRAKGNSGMVHCSEVRMEWANQRAKKIIFGQKKNFK